MVSPSTAGLESELPSSGEALEEDSSSKRPPLGASSCKFPRRRNIYQLAQQAVPVIVPCYTNLVLGLSSPFFLWKWKLYEVEKQVMKVEALKIYIVWYY
jgi:hypothetical protein